MWFTLSSGNRKKGKRLGQKSLLHDKGSNLLRRIQEEALAVI
jgi:hypothetical protein